MSVYTPIQASVTARQMPTEAGAEMYMHMMHGLHGPVGAVGDTPPKRQVKYLITLGVAVLAFGGIVLLAGKSSGNRGLSGIGELKLTRSLPAK